ncbi:MAG TPA: DUF2085 domain-containing protein [Chloroflexi bacterium]|mgnify:CR=1 FL=1|nr:DUF2085 domain-containing protein [Chloroflexota bacterium]
MKDVANQRVSGMLEKDRRKQASRSPLTPAQSSETGDAQVTTAEILAEVERRRVAKQAARQAEKLSTPVVAIANRFVFWLAKHWLTIFNTLAFLYVGLPILAPALMYLGMTGAARTIYLIYRPLCHQLPQRSFFLFGPQLTYTVSELERALGTSIDIGLETRALVGHASIGYKIGICQRDVAIYGTIFIAGLLYSLLRRRWRVPSLPLWAYFVIGILPMLLDGGYQFVSYLFPLIWPNGPLMPHETTPTMRVLTGTLFGMATVWLSYPLVQETMQEVEESLTEKV